MSLVLLQKEIVKKPICFIDLNYMSKQEKEDEFQRHGYRENIEGVFENLELVKIFLREYQKSNFDKNILEKTEYINVKNKINFIEQKIISTNDYVLNPKFYQALTQQREMFPLDEIIEQVQIGLNESLQKNSELKQLVVFLIVR